jgi:hypothetical protein
MRNDVSERGTVLQVVLGIMCCKFGKSVRPCNHITPVPTRVYVECLLPCTCLREATGSGTPNPLKCSRVSVWTVD